MPSLALIYILQLRFTRRIRVLPFCAPCAVNVVENKGVITVVFAAVMDDMEVLD